MNKYYEVKVICHDENGYEKYISFHPDKTGELRRTGGPRIDKALEKEMGDILKRFFEGKNIDKTQGDLFRKL